MKKADKLKQICKTVIFLSLAVFLFLSTAGVTLASNPEKKTVKVGYYKNGDFMSRNINGEYQGYNIEYLYEIAKYTDWQYEFVDCESWEGAYAKLVSGEVDLLPAVYYTDLRADECLFSAQPIGNICSTLNVRPDDTRYDFENYQSFANMRVGVTRGGKDADSFKQYCRDHDINLTIIPYAGTEELFADLDNKTLDGVAITHLGKKSTLRNVAQFSPEPIYIVAAPEKQNILQELDSAMADIDLRNPNYKAMIYSKYFSAASGLKPVFTEAEKEYMEQAEPLNAIYYSTWQPIEYQDERTQEFKGVSADLFAKIERETGLEFNFIPASTELEMLALLEDGTAQVVCGMVGDYLWNAKHNVDATMYYLNVPVAKISRHPEAKREEEASIAVVAGSLMDERYSRDNSEARIQYYNTINECFEALRRGEVTTVFANTYIASFILSDPLYKDFMVTRLLDYSDEISIGITQDADSRLFSILDKCIQYTSDEQMEEIVLKYQSVERPLSWNEILMEHSLEVIGCILFVAALIIGILGYALFIKNRNKKAIEKLSYEDSLTGLWNLAKFNIEVKNILKNAGNASYAIVYSDINQFKTINDVFGFEEGDAVLCDFAGILTKSLRFGECCARISADQFALLLIYTGWDELLERTKSIDNQMNAKLKAKNKKYRAVLIFGVYIVTETKKTDISLMLDLANYARLSVKNTHSSCTALYDEAMRRQKLLDRTLSDQMEDALEKGEFISYFQPKVNMNTGKIVGGEALVRWLNGKNQFMMPGDFIPLMERNQFIIQVDLYIYEQVCRLLKKWTEDGQELFPISCNFSRLHFKSDDFPEQLQKIAEQYQVPCRYIELEITESIIMENQAAVLKQINALKEKGFSISIDDFGTGYSSLGLLEELSVDVLKLDRSFLNKGMYGEREKVIVEGIVSIAEKLGIFILCEGVETKEQIEYLLSAGCVTAQGFYFSKPVQREEFECMVKEKRFEHSYGK